jgi:hypothetical protein
MIVIDVAGLATHTGRALPSLTEKQLVELPKGQAITLLEVIPA